MPGVSQVDESLTRLERRGFIDRTQRIPSRTQRDRMTVPELKTLARDHGCPHPAVGSALLKRLANTRPVPGHRSWCSRACRVVPAHEQNSPPDHTGDLSKVVLEQIGVRTPVDYTVTGGTGRFRNRTELRGYEAAIVARAVIDKTSWAHWLMKQPLNWPPFLCPRPTVGGFRHGDSGKRWPDAAARRRARRWACRGSRVVSTAPEQRFV